MKKIFLIITIISLGPNIYGQTINDTTMAERFNYEAVEKEEFLTKKGDWLIYISPMPGGFQKEYAPAKDFYMILKQYHPNGIISIYTKILGSVAFGIRDYFDKEWNRIKVVDEDEKFGKVKPKDIVVFLNEQGIINGETGETIFSKNPMKTDGSMYWQIGGKLDIRICKQDMLDEWSIKIKKRLGMDVSDNSNEKYVPFWIISCYVDNYKIDYFIDGDNIKNFFKEKEIYYVEILLVR
jgi:hypothetical protein